MRKVFYCDYDGIIVDSKRRLVELFNLNYRKIGEPLIDFEETTKWDCGIPKHLIEPIFAREDFFSHKLKMHDGAKDGLLRLKKMGYEIILYSKGSISNLGYKLLWVDKNLKGIFSGWVATGTNDIKMVKNQLDMSMKKEDGFSILFDDCYTNLVCDEDDKWKHHMPSYSICGKLSKRKDEEWNIDFTNKDMTAYHWDDLVDIINRIENYEINIIR